MTIKTMAQYEDALKPFANSKPELKEAAKQIGLLLFKNDAIAAKAIFKSECIKLNLVRWEQIAFSDLCTIEKEKLQAGV